MSEVRIGSLFSGAGGLDMAVESVFGGHTAWVCEFDQAASKVLAHRFPDSPNLGDITKVDWDQIAREQPVDVLCGGFPCFPAGTLIDAGEDGLRPIETLRVGDMVLTHERRRRAVTSVMRRQADDVLVLKAMGAPEFRATAEHPFYVRRKTDTGEWGAPQWVEAGQLVKGDMLAMPIDDPGAHSVLGEALAYVVGRWLGDGWIVDHKRTSKTPQGQRGSRVASRVHKAIICAAPGEAPELAAAITRAGLHATPAQERTVVKFHISSQDFVKTLRDFGRGAAGKRLPGWAFTATQAERAAMLLGWLHADGYRQSTGSWKATTVSAELAHGMARLARDVHGVATSVHYADAGPTTVIEGRTVNVRPQYQVVIPTVNKASFVEGGFAWVPLRSVREGEPCEVFNVSVDEDESYTAWGYTVHNCQDVSTAGRRAGLGDGTRSGLWAQFAGAIEALRPKYVVIENVRGLVSATAHRQGEDDDGDGSGDVEPGAAALGNGSGKPVLRAAGAVLGDLADLGYDAQWLTVTASSVGAPHRRERIFILAHPAGELWDWTAADAAVGGRDARVAEPEGLGREPVAGAGGDRAESDVPDAEGDGRGVRDSDEPGQAGGPLDVPGDDRGEGGGATEPGADALHAGHDAGRAELVVEHAFAAGGADESGGGGAVGGGAAPDAHGHAGGGHPGGVAAVEERPAQGGGPEGAGGEPGTAEHGRGAAGPGRAGSAADSAGGAGGDAELDDLREGGRGPGEPGVGAGERAVGRGDAAGEPAVAADADGGGLDRFGGAAVADGAEGVADAARRAVPARAGGCPGRRAAGAAADAVRGYRRGDEHQQRGHGEPVPAAAGPERE